MAEIEDAVINLDDEPNEADPDYWCFSFFPLYELTGSARFTAYRNKSA
jgi:hypothetical protein